LPIREIFERWNVNLSEQVRTRCSQCGMHVCVKPERAHSVMFLGTLYCITCHSDNQLFGDVPAAPAAGEADLAAPMDLDELQ
jgi:hypothetical protein